MRSPLSDSSLPGSVLDEPVAARGRRPAFKAAVVVIVVLCLSVVLIWWRNSSGGDGQDVERALVRELSVAERAAPVEFTGTTIDGEAISLTDFRGQVVVVNVWGSWCAPCHAEAPVLAKVSADSAERGVQFLGIDVRDNPASALAFDRRYGITYPSIDARDGQALLAFRHSIPPAAVPSTVVLDRQGRAAARVIGQIREATLRAILEPVLAEGTP